MSRQVRWSYGVTTVPERIDTTLPKSLESLNNAGFEFPSLFIDGVKDGSSYTAKFKNIAGVTCHSRRMSIIGNFLTALWELYIHEPFADYYALFQDDILCCRNLRTYLERTCPDFSGVPVYYNLYTVPENEELLASSVSRDGVWYQTRGTGRGALGLVFPANAIQPLLTAPDLYHRPRRETNSKRCVDGLVVDSLKSRGFREMVHYPSLIQHQVGQSTTLNTPDRAVSTTFRGEDYDPMKGFLCSSATG